MRLNFNQILHQMRFKPLKSTTPTNNTPPATLPNSDQLTKTSFLKKKIQEVYKSRSKAIKFTASLPLFKRKKFLLAGFTLLFISLPIAYLSLQSAKPAKAAWFDDNWAYRKAIAIPSHTSAENNVYVTVPTFDATDTSKFQADCGDLRFTKQNGELLPYYVVDCDATATVHVQFDTLPAGASTYFMYYGNPSAANGFSSADFSTAASGLGTQTLASEEQSQGPVAYWKFDEGYGTNTQDSTQNNNDGSISGATWQTEDQCISSKCLYFDGSNDVVTVSNTVSGIKTVSFWVKPITTSEQFIDLNGSAYIQASSGTISATGFTDPTIYVDGQVSSVIVANKWQYVTVTTGTALSGSAIKIGQISTNYGQGFIDEVKIYPYARTAAQIKADYAARGTSKGSAATLSSSKGQGDALSNGLVGYWKMDETSWNGTPNEVIDSSGNGNHGVGVGATSPPTTATGKFGNGGSFDGTEDYVNLTTPYNPSTVNFTATAWFKLDSADSASTHQESIFGNNQNTPFLGYKPSTKTFSSLRQYSSGSQTITSSATTNNLADSTWHHVVMSVDQTSYIVKFYLDGVFLSSSTIGTEGYNHSNGYFSKIGFSYIPSATTQWHGSLDEVRLYNRALSPKEVRDLYNWAPGPYTYLSFDEGTGTAINDKSGNGYSGTWNGSGTHWTTGKFGKAGKFDGSTDYVSFTSLPKPANLPVTIEFWARPNTSTPVGIFDSAPGQQYVFRNYSSGNVEWWNASPSISLGLTATTWTHLAFIYDYSGGNQTITWYKNGIKQTTGSTVGAGTWAWTTFRLGNINGGSAGWYSGDLDEFKIYNYARSSKQIVEDMNAGHPAPGSPVGSAVGYWKFDEGYGTTAQDSSANNYDATLYNTPTWTNNGKFNKALDFDASSSEYLLVANTNNRIIPSGNTAFTTSMWINPDSVTTATVKSIMTNETYTVSGFRYGINSSSKLDFWSTESGGTTALTSNTTLSAGTWYHIVMAYDGSSAKLYINGKQEASDTSASIVSNTNNILIANAIGGKENYDGRIDEIKFYTFALTQDEILVDMNQGSAMVLGSLSDTSGLTGGSVASSSAAAAYCIPGDTTSCAAPVGEWKLDEKSGTSLYDTSGNGKTLTVYNSPSWIHGKIGGALSFSGSGSQYAGITDSGTTSLDIDGNLTIEAWVKWNRFKDYGVIVQKATGGSGVTFNYGLWSYSNQMTCIIGNGTIINTISINSSYISTGTWHHVACVANGSQLIPYLDGKAYTPATQTITPVPNDNLFSISQASYVIDGTIDQVRIYNYARSAAQIAWDYNRGGPVGWWKLDECQGITANDASGNANNGTITIGATGTNTSAGTCTGSAGEAWKDGATGKYNSSLEFDGTDDFASVADTPQTDPTTAWTLSAWIKRTATGVQHDILEKYDWVTGKGNYAMRITSGNKFIAYTIDGQTFDDCGTTSTTINSGTWYHVIATFDSTTDKLICYVNGITEATNNSATKNPPDSTVTMKIGCQGDGCSSKFSGQIDDIRVYNYALTPTQVKTLYNENSSVRFGQ